ncbi:DUF4179 domain-containing protein [Lysinibacillus sp. NPDC096418]|uniref:DUF4179 domain-containing protein n=1 Tax=Lysinibacillus sp. NPDC096418 TaxID=3364138 RepID=UPI003805C76C
MENNIKKTIDDIDVPLEKLDQVIEKGMQHKKKKQKKSFAMAMLLVVATGGLVLGSGFISPKMANVLADVPLIGFMYDIEKYDEGLLNALSDDNKVTLNETVVSNGLPITVEEIVYDGARLDVIFSMPSYEGKYASSIHVDGKEINAGSSMRILENNDVFRGVWETRMPDNLPDAFDLTFNIHQIDDPTAKWVYRTPIQKVKNNIKTLATGQTGEIDGISFTVDHLETSTTTTKLNVKFDALMEKIFSEERVLFETVTDQNGTPIRVLDKSGSGDENGVTYTYLLGPLSEEITELKILYYFVPFYHEREDIIVPLADKFPQRISQGKMGDIVITNVEHKGSEATMTFYVDSDFPYNDVLMPNFLEIEVESGESLTTQILNPIGPNEYQLTFQANAGKPLVHTIANTPDMKVEQSAIVTIPIK